MVSYEDEELEGEEEEGGELVEGGWVVLGFLGGCFGGLSWCDEGEVCF